ncbi:hypothetical protein HYPSUDRAFT_85269 [Hypholoma sublateritium FD-334 SS-4]|uniref:Uncharacterized protein n=1 Tax=Hypholoma sublateritium (strain FD-334 SS-4) TaxID=945553 RepID=A0A0D2MNM3_HYPSF|nr:hypothetical protein HYPSUDRAFT_85269 [Hypholoma sublateritium FD-334 SS-4]
MLPYTCTDNCWCIPHSVALTDLRAVPTEPSSCHRPDGRHSSAQSSLHHTHKLPSRTNPVPVTPVVFIQFMSH